MKITIEVTGWLKKFTHGNAKIELEVMAGTMVCEVLAGFNFPKDEIGFISVRNANADGDRLVDEEYVICDGDLLRLYSPIVAG